MERRRVGLLFGGRSVEHEVSLASAKSVLEALDPDRFDTTLIALVMSIPIMFAASAVQKQEEAFLAEIEDYCDEYLVRRL